MSPENAKRALRRYQRFTTHARRARIKQQKGEPTAAEVRELSPIRGCDGSNERDGTEMRHKAPSPRTGHQSRHREPTIQELRNDELFSQEIDDLGL